MGHASHRVVLHFGRVSYTLWGGESHVLCKWILCLLNHRIHGQVHLLGTLCKILGAEGEVGTGFLQAGRHLSRPRCTHEHEAKQNQRPSTAAQRQEKKERPSTASTTTGQQHATALQNTAVSPHKASALHLDTQESVNPTNMSSILALEASELLMVHKLDLEEIMLELRSQHMLSILKSLGREGSTLATDLEDHYPHLLPHIGACLEACKFEATHFLFQAGKKAEEIFLLSKGTACLLHPLSQSVTAHVDPAALGGRQLPVIRGKHSKSETLVSVSIMQAPCILGLHNNAWSRRGGSGNMETGNMETGRHGERLLYGMSAQATSSVEAYVLKRSAMENCTPELKTRFFDKFAKCLEHLTFVNQEGLSKKRVAHSRTQTFLENPTQATPGDPAMLLHVRHQKEHAAMGMGEGVARTRLSRTRKVDVGRHTQGSLQGAAATLGEGDMHWCLAAGVTGQTYRVGRQCPHCFRLTYPEESAICHQCGFECQSSWQPTLGGIQQDAMSTIDHLLYTRQQKRQSQHSSSPKPGMHVEQTHSALSTILSDQNRLVSLATSPYHSEMHHAPQDNSGSHDASHGPPESHALQEEHIQPPFIGRGLTRWKRPDTLQLADLDDEMQHTSPHASSNHTSALESPMCHSIGTPRCPSTEYTWTHVTQSPLSLHASKYSEHEKSDEAHSTHGPDRMLRPLTAHCLLAVEPRAGSDMHQHQQTMGSRSSRRTVTKVQRPMSSCPYLGNSASAAAHMASEISAVAFQTRRGAKTPATSRSAKARLRAQSALGNGPSARASYFPSDERPCTSPTREKYGLGARPASSLGFNSLPPSAQHHPHLNVSGTPQEAHTHKRTHTYTNLPRSRPSSSLQQYLAKKPLDAPRTHSAQPYSTARAELVGYFDSDQSRRMHQVSRIGAEEAHLGAFLDVGVKSRGPAPFLVASATRSQVILRRSAPKYTRLAALHSERHRTGCLY